MSLDTQEFKYKPTNFGTITNRIPLHQVDISPEQLTIELMKGKTFCPATFKEVDGVLARNQNCWSSQQILALDFDNEIKVDDPNNKGKKIGIKKLTMTLEQAIKEFKDSAMFIYTSFSHKEDWHKFRVVFALKEPSYSELDVKATYDKFQSKYPYIDKSCNDTARMFFGGKDLHVLDYNNRIPIVKGLSSKPIPIGVKNTKEKDYSPDILVLCKESNCGYKPSDEYNHIELIKSQSKQFNKLSNIDLPPIIFNTRKEVYHYLKQINLHHYLNIHSKSCFDIFHSETSPSGSIFIHPETNYWWYKCWSDSDPFKGTIIEVTERLTGLTKPKSLKWLMDTFNITLVKTEWQQAQEDLWNMNIEFLNDDELISESYKIFNSIMRSSTYYALIRELHLIAIENVSSMNKHGDKENAIFYTSIDYIMKRMNRYYDFDKFKHSKKKRAGTILSLFAFLRLIERHDLNDVPKVFADRAKLEAAQRKLSNTITFYSLPSYDATHMIEVEKYSKAFRDNHMTIGNFDLQMVRQTLGDEEAEKVFPMRKKENVSNFNLTTCAKLEKTMLKYIEEFGWVTEERIIQNTNLDIDIEQAMRLRDSRYKTILKDHTITEDEKIKWEYTYKRGQLKKMLGGILSKHKLDRGYCNFELMEKIGIPQHYSEKGNAIYPIVIYKNKIKNTEE